MAKKRLLRNKKEIREMIEQSEMKFVMLNNRLFDDFYSKGKVGYRPDLNEEEKCWIDHKGEGHAFKEFLDENKTIEVTFDERDFILIILIKFLSQLQFQGYTQELADYLNFSDKRVKERLRKLQFIQVEMNNIYNHKYNTRSIYPDGKKVRLLNEEKVEGYESGTKRIFYKWYLNFDCDYKREINKDGKEVDTPINFFKVTIYDLDLFTSGQLNEEEFITYLYFIRSYNSNNNIWHSTENLSKHINIKDTRVTERIVNKLVVERVKDKFVDDENQSFPLVHVDRPANFEQKIRDRQQPSSSYKPIYNLQMFLRFNGDDPNPYNQTMVTT